MRILEKKEKKSIIKLNSPTGWILVVCLIISLISLIVYLTETGFSDDSLFLALAVLRYSSIMVFVCSFYKLLLNIYRIFKLRKISFINIIKMIIYLILILYGIFIILLEALIVVIARGNV